MSLVEDVAKFALTQSLAYTIKNPVEALAATAIVSNPTTRRIGLKIAAYLIKEQIKQTVFIAKLIYTETLAGVAPGAASRANVLRAARVSTVGFSGAAATALVGAAAVGLATAPQVSYDVFSNPETYPGGATPGVILEARFQR